MEEQLTELIGFLHDPKIEVRAIALHHLVGYSAKESEYRWLLLKHRKTVIPDLKALVREDPITAHDALRALINLSTDQSLCPELGDDKFIKHLALLITIPKSVLADLACMLLSNLTKHADVSSKVLETKVKPLPELSTSENLMDHLVEVFLKGVDMAYNPEADFHFLASVFANISLSQAGRDYFLTKAKHDDLYPISKITCFSEHKNVIRRGGADTTMKNVCFETSKHSLLLDVDEVNLLPFVLLPLCGAEEYDLEEFERFPEEIQMLPEDKVREPDARLRLILCEAILLLTTTRLGRDFLREKEVYRIIQRLHLAEGDQDDRVANMCDEIVQMLIRDEGDEKIVEMEEHAKEKVEEIDEDMVIEEIV
ncbi:hypothetical protein BZG36_02963 [Bifiguratus adelaidae]|uniref:Protein HGH1 homolog n=1 Tax=Bifiguratus adelaidae TaxID=1938954 RepID=A0A261Y0V5_9FUNG|nr:hypothetical protein BZG36_02963 [Bifiguratus adelaidae]